MQCGNTLPMLVLCRVHANPCIVGWAHTGLFCSPRGPGRRAGARAATRQQQPHAECPSPQGKILTNLGGPSRLPPGNASFLETCLGGPRAFGQGPLKARTLPPCGRPHCGTWAGPNFWCQNCAPNCTPNFWQVSWRNAAKHRPECFGQIAKVSWRNPHRICTEFCGFSSPNAATQHWRCDARGVY